MYQGMGYFCERMDRVCVCTRKGAISVRGWTMGFLFVCFVWGGGSGRLKDFELEKWLAVVTVTSS